jgi:two-component system response regulator DesR
LIRILLAMPGGLLRGALRYVLSAQPDIDVVAEHDAVDSTIAAVRATTPDVTILDLDLLHLENPVRDAVEAARAAYADMPHCKVLVLVDPRRPGVGSQIAGVPPTIGFLAQTAPPERVVDAVRRLTRDEPIVDADLLIAALAPKGPLTAKELQVLHAAAMGWPVREIAAKLGLSPGTVRNHLSRVVAKTGARTRIEAIHLAREAGWI